MSDKIQNIKLKLSAIQRDLDYVTESTKTLIATFYYPEHGNGSLIRRTVKVSTATPTHIIGFDERVQDNRTFLVTKVIDLSMTFG